MPYRPSTATGPSKAFDQLPRTREKDDDGKVVSVEDNVGWVGRSLAATQKVRTKAKAKEPPPSQCTFVLLVGGKDPYAFRLRHAQSVLRYDLTPSLWSHVALIVEHADNLGDSVLLEVSLQPPDGFWLPTTSNGLQVNHLRHYADPHIYPNVALLRVPVARSVWAKETSSDERSLIETFIKQRVVLDVTPLLHRWLAHVWQIDRGENPLATSTGIPSAAAIEALVSLAGYDISPGLDSALSAPEAFWQSARWWHPYFDSMQRSVIAGRWHSEHFLNHGVFPEFDAERDRFLQEPDGHHDRARSGKPETRT